MSFEIINTFIYQMFTFLQQTLFLSCLGLYWKWITTLNNLNIFTFFILIFSSSVHIFIFCPWEFKSFVAVHWSIHPFSSPSIPGGYCRSRVLRYFFWRITSETTVTTLPCQILQHFQLKLWILSSHLVLGLPLGLLSGGSAWRKICLAILPCDIKVRVRVNPNPNTCL